MQDDRERVLRKQALRYRMLRRLYDATESNRRQHVSFFDLAASDGLSNEEMQDTFHYLLGEHLIESQLIGPGLAAITHYGVKEVEQSIERPQSATEHFPPLVMAFYGPVGNVQNAPGSTALVHQNIGTPAAEIASLLREVRQSVGSLPPAERAEAGEVVDLLEEEVLAESPNKGRVRVYAKALGAFLRDAGANALGTLVAELLKRP